MSLDHYGFVNNLAYSERELQEKFLNKEKKVTDFILTNFEDKNKFDYFLDIFRNKGFRLALYDSLVMELTNNNYKLCSKLSKRLVIPSFQICFD